MRDEPIAAHSAQPLGDVLLVLAAALLVAGAGRAFWRPAPSQPARDLMARVDQDDDGRITAAEFDRVAGPGVPFEAMDLDGSGTLTADELDPFLEHATPLLFEAAQRRHE